jgi:hypothetical protein
MLACKRLFHLYAECEHSVWNSYVRPDTFNGEFGCGVEIMKRFSIIAKKRPELSAAMTVAAMLAAGTIAKLGVAAHLIQLIH